MPRRRPQIAARVSLWLACAGLGPWGCAKHAPNATPEATVAAYARALARGDAASALALSSPGAREGLSTSALEEALSHYEREAQALSESLSAPIARVEQSARVTLADGSQVWLERGEEGWLVVSPPPQPYDRSTPRRAVRAFVRALRHQRWEVLLGLMPDAARGDLSAEELGENLLAQRQEWERMLTLLETSLDNPIEIVGDRATMPYGDGYAVRFLREEGLWKVEDPE